MPISSEELSNRHEGLVELLAADGELDANELDLTVSPAALDFRIKAPGGQAGHLASFRYFEKYEWQNDVWSLAEYVYLISWQNGLGQYEYHWHPFQWSDGESVLHIHCTPPRGTRSHSRGHFILLEEARSDLMIRYASEHPVDCAGLYPLGQAS